MHAALCVRRRLATALAIAVALALIGGGALSARQDPQGKLDPGDVTKALSEAAAKGNFDESSASKLLDEAGISGKDQAAWLKNLKEKAQEQNASFKGDWDLGQVYRGRDYKLTYPLTNNCKVGRVVTIKYPANIGLTGPVEVTVPPKSTVDVPMTLELSTPPLPPLPWPVGVNLACYDIAGDLTLTHEQYEYLDSDTYYVCHEMKRTHTVSMHVHQHGPPDPPAPPGGGGKNKKSSRACNLLWNHGEFYPEGNKREPNDCRDEIRLEALTFFDEQVAPLSAADKEKLKWAWVPNREQLLLMSVNELLDAKARANETARGPK